MSEKHCEELNGTQSLDSGSNKVMKFADEVLQPRKPSDCKAKIGSTAIRGATPGFMPK